MTTVAETRVFIAGSRRLSKLSDDVKRRIDNIVEKGLTVVIGDANGVDKTVQKYLDKKHYENVVVYCMEGVCRNNVGGWPTRSITPSTSGKKDFAYFSTKDRVMAQEADYGLMLWDGQSRGTLTSIVDLMRRKKPVVVHLSTEKSFYNLPSTDLREMLTRIDSLGFGEIGEDLRKLTPADRSRKIHNLSMFE